MENTSNKEDIELLNGFISGDNDAFGRIVKKYRERIYNIAFGITRSHSDADDLSQEIFAKLYFIIPEYNEKKAAFYTWIYRIAVNHILKFIRKKPAVIHGNEMPADNKTPEAELEKEEQAQIVRNAVDKLPPTQKMIVMLYEIEEYSHKEIAAILKCAVPTVRWNLFIALNKLKKALKNS